MSAMRAVLGAQCFSIGVIYGVGKDLVMSVVELFDLIKDLALAECYERLHRPRTWYEHALDLTHPLRSLGLYAIGGFLGEATLRQAYDGREALLTALKIAFDNPREAFGALAGEYVEKWRTFQRHYADPSLESQFKAGEVFGELLALMLGLLAAGAGLAVFFAKLAAKVPALAKALNRLTRAANGVARKKLGGGNAPPSISTTGASTPSQLKKMKEARVVDDQPHEVAAATPNETPSPEKTQVVAGYQRQRVPKPSVADPKLNNLVKDLYKGADTREPIGTGSTADAIRHEALTGKPVGGKFHTDKGRQYSRALEKWLHKNQDASVSDRQAAQSMLNDLKDALGGSE